MTKISFCIPCYRSEKTIERVVSDIHAVMKEHLNEYEEEIVCVVDGSPDNVFGVLVEMAKTDKTLKVVNLSKNYGQPGARMASLRYATGDYQVCLDDDGQCPIENFWEMMQPILSGYDVAMAKYPVKKQSTFKNFGSWVNEKMVHFLLDVPKDYYFSNFWIMKSYVTKQILTYHNPYPYLTGLVAGITNSIAYIEMEEHDRISGTTGYTFRKLIESWLNGALNFSVKPVRISTMLGSFCGVLGVFIALFQIVRKLCGADINTGYTSIIASIFIVGGMQMVILGVIGEYIGRTFISINNTPQYVVKDEINIGENNLVVLKNVQYRG